MRVCVLLLPTIIMIPTYPIPLFILFRPEFEYSCGRNSQIWLVRDGAKRAVSSHRVSSLARHKTVPHGYLEHR